MKVAFAKGDKNGCCWWSAIDLKFGRGLCDYSGVESSGQFRASRSFLQSGEAPNNPVTCVTPAQLELRTFSTQSPITIALEIKPQSGRGQLLDQGHEYVGGMKIKMLGLLDATISAAWSIPLPCFYVQSFVASIGLPEEMPILSLTPFVMPRCQFVTPTQF